MITTQLTNSVQSHIDEVLHELIDIRHDIHAHPELGYAETRTSQVIQDFLSSHDISFKAGLAKGTGVLGHIEGTGDKAVGLRADIDALPIVEENTFDWKSVHEGCMHACGHDGHTTMLLGAARYLAETKNFEGCVHFIFQPAEEGGAGGKMMREQGILENPKVQQIYALHVAGTMPMGTLASRKGTLLAATSTVKIVVKGNGGHAAAPHETIDPVVTGSKIVVELQTIISRELNPLESGVISITMTKGGNASNVIPSTMELQGTIRSLTLEGINKLQKRVKEVAEAIAIANRCEAEVTFLGNDYPPTINDGDCWELGKASAMEILGDEKVSEMSPIMGGEDFAYYTQQIPGCFSFIGVGNPEINAVYDVHHPMFKVDEEALSLGTAIHVNNALKALDSLRED